MAIKSTKVVFIPKGSNSKIVSYLSSKNFSLSVIDKYMINFLGYAQAGWVNVNATKLTRGDFLYKITHSKAALKEIKLIPGETKEIFFKDVAKKLKISYKKLMIEYNNQTKIKDGVILPESYNLPIGMREHHLIRYLISYSTNIHKRLSKKVFGEFLWQRWKKYIIIASIIQKESVNNEEMPIVSSVIHNRLKKGMKLQMDGTLNYGLNSHKKVTPYMIRNDTSRYNTYKYKGLPKEPICAISIDALKAAIKPATTKYLYFVRSKKTGTHLFTSSYAQHIRNFKK